MRGLSVGAISLQIFTILEYKHHLQNQIPRREAAGADKRNPSRALGENHAFTDPAH